jgi:hypothetical protein
VLRLSAVEDCCLQIDRPPWPTSPEAEHSKIRLVAALSSLRSSLLHLELQELLLILTNVFLLAAPPLDLEAPLADSNQVRHDPSLPAHAHAVPMSSTAGALSCLLAWSHHAVVAATVAANVADTM